MDTKQKRWWDVIALLLLVFALWASALRLEVTNWTEQISRVDFLITVSILLGALLGLSLFERKTVYWVAAAYSIFFLTWQLSATVESNAIWSLRVGEVGYRLRISLTAFFSNQPNQDTMLFLALMSLLYWFIGLTAGYMLLRYGRPWVPLLAAGLALFIIDFNNPFIDHRYRYSGAFVLLSLMLVGRLYYLKSRRDWIENGVSIDFETGFSLGRSMVVGGLLVVLFAWNVPSVFEALTPGTEANRSISETWGGLKNRISNAVIGLQNPVVYVSDTYNDRMELGNGTPLSDKTVFTARAAARPSNFRFYWRGYGYDFYDGNQWSNTVTTRQVLSDEDWPLTYPVLEGRRTIDVTIRSISGDLKTLYLPSMLLSIDRQARIVGEVIGEDQYDVIGVLSSLPVRVDDSFKAQVWVDTPTATQLREAGDEYPEWVANRYLQLPDEFPERIREEALRVTADHETAYDQVVAVTQYLRETITYQETIPNPPAGVDKIEWFLFEYKQGFCNYYASAEVLMLRSLGIPARLAVGYAEGTYIEDDNFFDVRVKDSHAWPEVYFPGAGWVEFEPTVSQPLTELPEGDSTDPETDDGGFIGPPVGEENPDPTAGDTDSRLNEIEDVELAPDGSESRMISWAWVGGFVALLAAVLGLWFWRHPDWLKRPFPIMMEESLKNHGFESPLLFRFWARQVRLTPIERMFDRISWMLWLLGVKVADGDTPTEQVDALVERVPEASTHAGILLQEYHRAEFSPHPFDINLARSAHLSLWRMVMPAWTRRVLKLSPGT